MTLPIQSNFDTALPPIVLVVGDDPATRDLYSLVLESSGMWVATASEPVNAVETAIEVRPDVIVTELEFHGAPAGLRLLEAIRHNPLTADVPVVLLTGRPPEPRASRDHRTTELLLLKPVAPEELVSHVTDLVNRSRDRRECSSGATPAAPVAHRSDGILARPRDTRAPGDHLLRRCPSCTQPLGWVETGRIDGVEYDYYHWCDSGCGLYCYDRDADRWVKLVG